MTKAKKYSPRTSGVTLVMRQHADGSCFIGTANCMFAFDPGSAAQCRRVCLLYHISEEALTKLTQNAQQSPDEFTFMTL